MRKPARPAAQPIRVLKLSALQNPACREAAGHMLCDPLFGDLQPGFLRLHGAERTEAAATPPPTFDTAFHGPNTLGGWFVQPRSLA